MKLVFGDPLAHCCGAADAARDHLLELVDVIGAAPLLVLHHVDSAFGLGLLYQLAVRPHPHLAEGLGELIAGERRRVQACQRNELPAVAQLRESPDIRLLLVPRHSRLPVERGREIVREPARRNCKYGFEQ